MRNRVIRTVDVPQTLTGQMMIRAEIIRSIVYTSPMQAAVEFTVRYTVLPELTADVQAFERDLLAPFNSDDTGGNAA